jgi:hypothetical protein
MAIFEIASNKGHPYMIDYQVSLQRAIRYLYAQADFWTCTGTSLDRLTEICHRFGLTT